jgi:hypothetical protein
VVSSALGTVDETPSDLEGAKMNRRMLRRLAVVSAAFVVAVDGDSETSDSKGG